MHALLAELLDTVVKAIVAAVTTFALSALFKKSVFRILTFSHICGLTT
jgi:hypothetical protein